MFHTDVDKQFAERTAFMYVVMIVIFWICQWLLAGASSGRVLSGYVVMNAIAMFLLWGMSMVRIHFLRKHQRVSLGLYMLLFVFPCIFGYVHYAVGTSITGY